MNPGIWSRLPEDLLEHVLSFLPLKDFLKIRSTCKHFKSLLYSPFFISKHSSSFSSSSNPCSFLLLSHPQIRPNYSLYDTILNTWRNIPLPLSPALLCAPSSSSLLSISGGLLCYSLPNSSSFLVCNLLAGASRTVNFPKNPFPFSFDSLTLAATPTGFKIFALRSSSSSTAAFLYDSELDLWVQLNRLDSIMGDTYHYRQHGVVSCNGSLYFTIQDPLSIVEFCLETEKWERMLVNLPAEYQLSFVRLVSDGHRKLFLIGGIGQYGISRSVKIWERRVEGEDWIEIGNVPETMCRKFMSVCYHNYEHVYGFWHQGLICLCCYTWPEILYFEVSTRSWHWVPTSPAVPENWSCGFRWFSLVPQLHALV